MTRKRTANRNMAVEICSLDSVVRRLAPLRPSGRPGGPMRSEPAEAIAVDSELILDFLGDLVDALADALALLAGLALDVAFELLASPLKPVEVVAGERPPGFL